MSLTDEQVKKLKDFLEQQFQIARNTNEEAQYDPFPEERYESWGRMEALKEVASFLKDELGLS